MLLSVNSPFLFDNILNRDSKINEIKFEIWIKDYCIAFVVKPLNPNEIHSNQLILSVTHKGYQTYDEEGINFINELQKV